MIRHFFCAAAPSQTPRAAPSSFGLPRPPARRLWLGSGGAVMEFKADFKAQADFENRRWARKDRGKAFVGELLRSIHSPLEDKYDPRGEASDKRYKPSDALRDMFAEAARNPEDRIDGQCRVRFTRLKECIAEEAHSHPNGTEVSDELKNMRNVGDVDELVESRIRSYFEVLDDCDTGYIGPTQLHEELERFGCTATFEDLEKLFMADLHKKRASVDDFIILVARNPVLGDALQEARLHERSAGYVEDTKQDACSLCVQRHTRVDVELGKKRASQWLADRADEFLGDYACEPDEEALREAQRHYITEATNEKLKASIRKKVGLAPGANRFHAVVDEMNLTHVLRPHPDVFDWKEEVRFMFCGLDVDEVAEMTIDDYQRLVDFRTLDVYQDPNKEWKKVNAPEAVQIQF